MLVFPFCKINLGLWITRKRNDGYHDIETVFYPVKLCDILEIIKSPDNDFIFTTSGLEIPGDTAANLCVQTYHLLRKDYPIPPVRMHLHKIIPAGSGLGGGSSDGAFTLKALNEYFTLNLSPEQLYTYARRLGSDCAFFLQEKPAYARGKGDEMKEINIDLSSYSILLIKPHANVKTADAYGMIEPLKRKNSLKDVIFQPVTNWRESLVNDFERPVFERFPEIRKIKVSLYEAGAIYASMTGSGSAVYGLFSGVTPPEELFKGGPGLKSWVT